MNQFVEVAAVALLFIIRIGLPLVILLLIGTLVERAYSRQDARIEAEEFELEFEADEISEHRRKMA